jgi:hypothetical protein
MFKRPVLFVLLATLMLALSPNPMLGSLELSVGGAALPDQLPRAHLVSEVNNIGDVILSDGFALLPLGMNWVDDSTHGNWRDVYGGYGKQGVAFDGSKVLAASPKASVRPSETHAALATSLLAFGNVDITLKMKTVKQLRTPRPNTWEMAWVLWHYTDDVHFYYLVLKTNGWELGKEDPAYPGNQRFLITRSSPRFRPGTWYAVHIKQVGSTIKVWVGRTWLGSFTDRQRPYTWGKLGLYCEDSHVEFDNVKVVQA